MAAADEFMKYTVKVRNGSGCVIQPMNQSDYTYVLTSKHNFYDEYNDQLIEVNDGNIIKVVRQIKSTNGYWVPEEIALLIQKGENYFPHEEKDIAILKIPYIPDLNQLFVQEDYADETGFELCGYPKERNENGNTSFGFKNHRVTSFSANHGPLQAMVLEKNTEKHNIDGMSGGGVLRFHQHYISIIGIQSEIGRSKHPMGECCFVPVKYFNEIINENAIKLQPLLPPYLENFEILKKEILKLEGCWDKSFRIEATKQLQLIVSSITVTPYEIFKSDLAGFMLVFNEPTTTLQSKQLWKSWLVYLIMLSLHKSKPLSLESIKRLFNSIRLIHSSTTNDWMTILEDLFKSDLRGLANQGVLIVSTNSSAIENVIKQSVIPDITRAYNIDAEFRTDSILHPLLMFKFVHISAFEDDCITKDYMRLVKFTGDGISRLISEIKNNLNELLKTQPKQ